jgi:mannitol/fructose-specific phosphotransferase system IIA component
VCQQIIDTLINGNLTEADPQITAIANTISQICICLKAEFKPFLPLIIPALLKDAQKDLDFKMTDADEFEAKEEGEQKSGQQSMLLKIKGMEGAKQVTMNTNALEVKINAIQILKTLARNLETNIFEFVEDIAAVVIQKLLADPFAYTIRKESAKCMRFLIGACKEHPDKMKALYIMNYVVLVEEMNRRLQRQEFEQVNGILKELHKQLRLFEFFKDQGLTVYSPEDATTFINKMAEIVTLIRKEKEERMDSLKKKASKLDEEDNEMILEDIESMEKGVHQVMEITGCLLQNDGANLSAPVGQTLLPLFAQTLLNLESS